MSQLNMRVDSVASEIFKDMADGRGISQKELFTEMVNDKKQGKSVAFLEKIKEELNIELEEKNNTIKNQEEIIRTLQNKNQINPEDLVSITFKVSRQLRKELTQKAISLDTPRYDLLSVLLSSNKIDSYIPELENIEPETIT